MDIEIRLECKDGDYISIVIIIIIISSIGIIFIIIIITFHNMWQCFKSTHMQKYYVYELFYVITKSTPEMRPQVCHNGCRCMLVIAL